MNQIQVQLMDGRILTVERGTTLLDISRKLQHEYMSPIMLAEVNDKLRELQYTPDNDCILRFLTMEHPDGYRTYVRSLYFLFLSSAGEVLGDDVRIQIKHGVVGGTFCEIRQDQEEEPRITEEQIEAIRQRMQDMVCRNQPIIKSTYPLEEAMDLFELHRMPDKARLFRYRRFSVVNMYSLGANQDYFYGYMLPETGALRYFDLVPYQNGVVLMMPTRHYPHAVCSFRPSDKLFEVYGRSKQWSRILGVENAGALNDCIARGDISELVQVSEALHSKHIAAIASTIAQRAETTKIVLIAGPSSSGKTTFAKKLSIQLRAEGMRPHLISVDDYFVNRDSTPVGDDGKPNFECIEAIDTEQFNKDLKDLLEGRTVQIPFYNFKTGKREWRDRFLTLGEKDLLVIEGIHCLNEKLTEQIPRQEKYKIYISALTLINIDDHNRIPTTDGRLLRRMVRDHQYRGTTAAQTLSMWPSVRAGEEKNIFPYQEEADVMFNSAHIYELAILKQYAEPLLFNIGRYEPEYAEARRLIKFLDYFLGVSSEVVPTSSIIREFIGGGIYE